jgi:hypothetical protein
LESFLGGRRKFFDGGQVYLEWLERLPTPEQRSELEEVLSDKYGLQVSTRKKKAFKRLSGGLAHLDNSDLGIQEDDDQDIDGERGNVTVPLFDSLEMGFSGAPRGEKRKDLQYSDSSEFYDMGFGSEVDPSAGPVTSRATSEELRQKYISRVTELLEEEMMLEGDANAKVVFGTVRSGQRVETPFSLVVLGDVNPGADLTAGGDIVVLGSLRGTAHASAYDDESHDKVIIALQMRPVQLRIGSVISRGNDDQVAGVEIARIENRRIIVESYNPRTLPARKLN